MAATETKEITYNSSTDGVPPNKVRGLIAASQGIMMPGAPLYLSESGTWKLCDTTDGSDAWHGFLIGLQDKSQTWPLTAEQDGDTAIWVALISSKHRYVVYCESAGTDSAVAQSNVGNDYGLTVSATAGEVGYVSLDLNSTTNTGVVIMDIMSNVDPTDHTTSDAPGAALVRFETAIIEAQKA